MGDDVIPMRVCLHENFTKCYMLLLFDLNVGRLHANSSPPRPPPPPPPPLAARRGGFWGQEEERRHRCYQKTLCLVLAWLFEMDLMQATITEERVCLSFRVSKMKLFCRMTLVERADNVGIDDVIPGDSFLCASKFTKI